MEGGAASTASVSVRRDSSDLAVKNPCATPRVRITAPVCRRKCVFAPTVSPVKDARGLCANRLVNMAVDVFRRMSAGAHPGILAMPVNIASVNPIVKMVELA